MIRTLRLQNWRSYEDLNLQLEPGTTFVVAPNGVGKTSLVYGLAWAVFGDQSGINFKRSIRAGTAMAEVEVELDLPDGRRLVIRRTAKHRGSPKASYEIDGQRRTEDIARSELAEALGIELTVASRLAMMLGGGSEAARAVLKLEGHLHHAFGVAHLLRATETAESFAKDAVKRRDAVRATTKQRIENRAAIEKEIADLESQISRLMARATELEHLRDAAAAQKASVARHIALDDQRERYVQQRSRLVGAIEDLLNRALSSDSDNSITAALRLDLETSQDTVADITERTVQVRSTATAADEALQLLDAQDPICPTCIRPLTRHERSSAVSAHQTHQRAARAEIQRLEEERRSKQTHVQSVSRLLAQLEALQPPNADVATMDLPSPDNAEAFYQQALADLDEHNRRLGGAQSQLASLKAQIASDDEIRAQEVVLQEAYRREAAARASATALRYAADHVIATRIEPLANELRQRWKHLFTANGLSFASDGSIARVRDGQELPWDTLSGGERTWARIVTHLIVMGTTTSLPFAWFDEPLEHLDPRLRHAVAATLATATAGGSPRQLIVTTYEHAIAKQLADAVESARVISLRESIASAGSASTPRRSGEPASA